MTTQPLPVLPGMDILRIYCTRECALTQLTLCVSNPMTWLCFRYVYAHFCPILIATLQCFSMAKWMRGNELTVLVKLLAIYGLYSHRDLRRTRSAFDLYAIAIPNGWWHCRLWKIVPMEIQPPILMIFGPSLAPNIPLSTPPLNFPWER